LTKAGGKNNDFGRIPIQSAVLKSALDSTLGILGEPTREIIINQLKQRGIIFDGNNVYKLTDLEASFKVLFGEGASLVMEKLVKVLKEMRAFGEGAG
jgi:hypothetical protein